MEQAPLTLAALPPGYGLRPAQKGDFEAMQAIELATTALFSLETLPELMRGQTLPPELLQEGLAAGRLFAATAPDASLAGYALLRILDGLALLAQIDVLPAHGRRGLGTALVAAVAAKARQEGCPALYLTTFRHIAWNAPWYGRLGFAEIPEPDLPPAMRHILAEEAGAGLKQRLAMRLWL